MKTTATTLLAELESLNENSFALPSFSIGMRSSPATRRRKLEEWRSKRRHTQSCVACTPPRDRVLARLSLAAAAKRCAPVTTPKEVTTRLDGDDVSPLTMVCTPIASPSSSDDVWSPATPAYDNSFNRSYCSDSRNTFEGDSGITSSSMTDDRQDGSDLHGEDRLDCSDYENSVMEAYQNMQDVEEYAEVLDTPSSSIEQEVPSLTAAIVAIRSFEWNDSLPLSSPFPEHSYLNREILPRRLNDESENKSESLCHSTNVRLNQGISLNTPRRKYLPTVEGRAVLFALPEDDAVNDLSSVSGNDYERLLVENRRLRNRLHAVAESHDVTIGPVRDLYIEVSGMSVKSCFMVLNIAFPAQRRELLRKIQRLEQEVAELKEQRSK